MAEQKKPIWKSKTFWFNALTMGAQVSGFLPVAPATAGMIAAGANIALRAITKGPVTIIQDAAKE
jgi:hypothetical protein